MVEQIIHEGKMLSIIIRNEYNSSGIEFFTPNHFSQQLGYMKRNKDYIIKPHVHKPVERKIFDTQEVIIIKSGKARLDYYDDNKQYINSTIVKTGDIILLANGGHGFLMLEECEIVEVKQGPYVEDKDKVRFEPVSNENVKIN